MSLGSTLGNIGIALEIAALFGLVLGVDHGTVLAVALLGVIGPIVLYVLIIKFEPKNMKEKREKAEIEERQNQERARMRRMLGPDFVETKPGTFERIRRK